MCSIIRQYNLICGCSHYNNYPSLNKSKFSFLEAYLPFGLLLAPRFFFFCCKWNKTLLILRPHRCSKIWNRVYHVAKKDSFYKIPVVWLYIWCALYFSIYLSWCGNTEWINYWSLAFWASTVFKNKRECFRESGTHCLWAKSELFNTNSIKFIL